MFRKDLEIQGSHATKLFEIMYYNGDENNEKFYPRYIDIYMISPLIGALYGKKEDLCKEIINTKRIFAETVIKHERQLMMIYRLVMLYDKSNELNIEDRVYRAFRDYANRENNDNHKNNLEVFNMYLRGGISILHEKITKDAISFDDYIINYRDFITEYKNDFIDQVDYSEFQID